MCAFFNREISKAWLGQTLTVETSGETGTYAAAVIHNEVRLDLRQDDLGKEGRTIRRDVLAPLTKMRFGPGVPVPFFRRPLDPPRDLRELADVLSAAVNDLRLAVPARWAYDALGISPAREGEAVLRGTSVADSLVRAEPNAAP
jgi:phage gp29-like protein